MPRGSHSASKAANVLKKSIKNVSGSFMKSKLVLYLLLVLSILNVLFYLSQNNMHCLFMFIGVATLTYFFTKNMKFVLGVPLVVSSLLSCSILVKEGIDETLDKKKKKKRKKKEEFVSKIQPYALEEDEEVDPVYIDKSKTIENAYANLDKYLDSEGLKKLSSDTNNLIKKQSQLMDSMKHMGPLIKNMDGIMKNLNNTDMSQFGKVQEDLQGMVDTMSTKEKK